MPTCEIFTEPVLAEGEYDKIDRFCSQHAGLGNLDVVSSFLMDEFNVEISLDQDIVSGYAGDSSNLPGRADGLVRPEDERACAVVLRACRVAKIPVTISGGKSNLTGGATPDGGVVLSVSRMLSPPVSVDETFKTVSTPCGVLLEDMRNEVLKQTGRRFRFPVDPTSRSDALVGGCLACNASGFTPGRKGSMRDWVCSLRFLLPDGTLVRAGRGDYISEDGRFVVKVMNEEREWFVPTYPRPAIKNAGGPFSDPDGSLDFIDLVVGSEGVFGLVTACTLGLTENPSEYLDIFFSLPTEADALKLLRTALTRFDGDLGGLTAFEYFGVNCRRYMKHESRFFNGSDQVGIYIQEPLFDSDMEDAAGAWLETLADAGLDLSEESVLLLDTAQLRGLFMEARHSMPSNALEVVQSRGTFTIMTDTVVPPGSFSDFLDFAHNRIRAGNLDYLSFGHLGDCHLHFTVLPAKDQIEEGVRAYDDIVAKSADLGGVYSGEHGTGKRKRKDFLRCYGDAAVEQVWRCKSAVDTDRILNRGNVIL